MGETRRRAALIALALVAGVAAWPPVDRANAQVMCSNDADALETGVVGERAVAGASVAVQVSPKAGRTASVTDLTVAIAPGDPATPVAVPGLGTISTATVRLPVNAARAVVTISWNQGEEPGVAVACRGTDRVLIQVGPNARQLTAYLGQMKATQTQWARRRGLLTRAISGFDPPSTGDLAALFTYIRHFGRQGLLKLPPGRAAAVAYRDRVAAIPPHPSLSEVHSGMARSSMAILRPMTEYLQILSGATTLADITTAKRALGAERGQTRILRRTWSRSVNAAASKAGIATPAWVAEVGR